MSSAGKSCLVIAAMLLALAALPMAAQEEPPVDPPVLGPDLRVTKSGPEQAAAGSDVGYTVTVFNIGTEAAVGVTLEDLIPPGMTFVSATQNNGPVFTCSTSTPPDPPEITCTTPVMLAGESAQFTFVFNISPDAEPGTTFTNIATATTPGDLNEENNSGVAITTTPPPPQADMAVSKIGPATAGPGTDVTFTIGVTNHGPDAAADVVLQDTLPDDMAPPDDMTFVSLTQSGFAMSCVTPAVGDDGTISCAAATFPAGATATLTLVAHIPAETPSGTPLVNTATITSSTNDVNEENDASTITVTTSAVDLSVLKTGPGTAAAGDDITYTLTVANAGPDVAINANLTDALPLDTTLVSFAQNNGPAASCVTPPPGSHGTVACNWALFGSGASAQFTLVIRIGDTTSITNTAIVTSDTFDIDPADDTSSVTTTVTPSADLSVNKSGPATITAGSNATYTIAVTNDGPSTATNVSLTDTLPAGATFVSMTQNSGPPFTCGTTTCTIASLAPETSATFTLVARIAPSTPSGSNVTNTANVDATTADPDGTDNTTSFPTSITTSADVSVTKNGPATIAAGSNATYTIVVTNSGPSDAGNVSLTDTLPAEATFVSMTQNSGPTFICTTTTCTIATLAAGASANFTLVAQIAPSTASGSSVTNTANVSSTTPDPDGTDNTSSVTTTVARNADVSVTKNGPATVTAGTNATYTIAVTNSGPSDAGNVSLTDTLPTGATFVSMTQNSGPAFTCTTTTCTIATLAAGASATFTLVAQIAPSTASGSSVTNTANVSSTTPDPDGTDNTSSVTTTVARDADVSVTKNGPATVTAGTNATYTINVTNSGPSDATDVSLTDTPPTGATFVSMTQNSGPAFTCTTTTCTIATLAAGASATFTLVAQIAPSTASGSSVTNTANVSSTTPDPDGTDNTSSSTATAAASADLAVVKLGPAAVEAGTNVTYTVTLSNNGPSAAANVTLSDPLPPGTTFVSSSQSGPPFSCDATIVCTAPSMPASSSTVFTFVLNVSPSAGGSTLTNTATVSSTTPDPSPANASSSTSAPVSPQTTDVSITKTANATRFAAGQSATYTIVVTNHGPGAALDTTVTDVLPAGTTLTSSSSTQGTCSGSPTVTCTLGTLPANSSATITLNVTLPQTTGILTNTATVTISNGDTNPANNTSTAILAVAENIPTLSTIAMAMLGVMLAMIAVKRM